MNERVAIWFLCGGLAVVACHREPPTAPIASAQHAAQGRRDLTSPPESKVSPQEPVISPGEQVTAGRNVTSNHRTTALEEAVKDAEVIAKNWLSAVLAGGAQELESYTSFPFAYGSTDQVKQCERSIDRAQGMVDFVGCMATQERMFLDELRNAIANDDLGFALVEPMAVYGSLVKSIGHVADHERVVQGYVNGDGITYEVAFIVAPVAGTPGRVRLFVMNTEFPE